MKLLVLVLAFAFLPAQDPVQQAADKVSAQIDSISRDVDVKNRIEHEYYLMSRDLIALKDPKVMAVMEPHLRKMERIAQQKSR